MLLPAAFNASVSVSSEMGFLVHSLNQGRTSVLADESRDGLF